MSPLHEPRFLCVHVPEFAAQARLRHRPELRSKAVAILDGIPPLQTVYSTTRRARELGVSRGVTRAELDSFPSVKGLLRSEAEERGAAAALLELLWRYSPRVQVLPPHDASHRLVADIAGTERLFGQPAHLAHTLQQDVHALGLAALCAISGNFHTAVCAASYAGKKPTIVARGNEGAALARLPLKALDILTDEQQETFALWGLHTLGEIAALPEVQLIARMGQTGKQVWLMTRGECQHVMQPEEERFTLEERASFDAPVEMLDSLLFVLLPMLEQLILRANGRAQALASVTVRLQLTNRAADDTAAPPEAKEYARTIKSALPLADSRVWLKLLHLELQAHPPGAPAIAMHLQAEPGERARAQLGLFSPQLPEPSRLDITLARLRGLVGEGRVGRPQLLDTNRPDSFTMERFKAPVQAGRTSTKKPTKVLQPEHPNSDVRRALALRRLRPPALLKLHVADGKPTLFFWQGTRYEIAAAYGPWRQSGDWWSTEAWSREEWDITATAADGTVLACRIARDLLQKHWALEGLYD